MNLTTFDYFNSAFCLFCVIITVSLSSWRIYEYSLDRDLTRINFKRFHQNEDDLYPSISLCFFDPYLPEKLKKYDTNLTQLQYTKFLQGHSWDEKVVGVDYENWDEKLLGVDLSLIHI